MVDRRPTLSTTERVRLFTLHGGVCHICRTAIDGVRQRWEIEHVVPRGLIGKTADDDDNMRPAHVRPCHAEKTRRDRDDIARAVRRQAKYLGAVRPRHVMPGSRLSPWKKRMDGTVEQRQER